MSQAGSRFGFGRLACLFAAAMLAFGGVAATASSSYAQERERPRTLFQLLFRSGEKAETRKAAPSKSKSRSKSAKSSRPKVVEVPAVEKSDTAKVVLVVGDFMANGVSEGLTEVYAQNPDVKVIERSNGSSGFVRPDFYNWPEEIKALIDTEKPSAVVFMLGSNDRQQMTVGEVREEPMSDIWVAEYTKRASALAGAIKEKGVPFVWVGMPAFKSKKMTSDMLVLNDAFRTAAQAGGGEFIDIWDGFVDENGAYVQTGPDINGQPVRLRASDGINFSRPGKRKAAFYTEKPLAKILGGGGVNAPAVQFLGTGNGTANPLTVDRTVPVSLIDPELDGGAELMGGQAPAPRASELRTIGERLVIEGIAPAATPGRADDFGGGSSAAAATPMPEDDTTTAASGREPEPLAR
ncbi:MAG: DUF459 domain-containing protein [Rhizobiaceae bacterium]